MPFDVCRFLVTTVSGGAIGAVLIVHAAARQRHALFRKHVFETRQGILDRLTPSSFKGATNTSTLRMFSRYFILYFKFLATTTNTLTDVLLLLHPFAFPLSPL